MLSPKSDQLINYGDSIIIYSTYLGRTQIYYLTLEDEKKIFDCYQGHFAHSYFVGMEYGTKCTGKNGFIYVLFPTPELWTLALQHRTEILYCNDISMIILHLELKPGMIVVESGTGSGSLSTSFARAVAPHGHLYTFEFHQERAEAAKVDFKVNGMSDVITVTCADAIKDGFHPDGQPDIAYPYCDAVFLDLPSPWLALESAKKCLRPNRMLCSFSPCIEQVQRTCLALGEIGFYDITTVECLNRPFRVRKIDDQEDSEEEQEEGEKKKKKKNRSALKQKRSNVVDEKGERPLNLADYVTRPTPVIRGHTGYLTFARKSLG